MTTVSLSDLLNARDESIRIPHARRSALRTLRIRLHAPAWLRPALILLATFSAEHGLVLCGCAAVVTSAAMLSIKLGWLVAGLAFFFLEARRR